MSTTKVGELTRQIQAEIAKIFTEIEKMRIDNQKTIWRQEKLAKRQRCIPWSWVHR